MNEVGESSVDGKLKKLWERGVSIDLLPLLNHGRTNPLYPLPICIRPRTKRHTLVIIYIYRGGVRLHFTNGTTGGNKQLF